ncbi:MAG: glycosyltransferase family 2 protein [Oscillospiraceae bacterium]|nr:glycosyltransferase family 2 protein [Oscillospiraceae bacterium]
MIMLSVLVTFYNMEDYVDRTMKSIFNQKVNFDYEIVIGEDGSSDGTLAKLRAWQEKYPDVIRIIVQPREDREYLSAERASGNRLSLLEQVKGKYFIYLDGDDCYCDEMKFQKQVDILEDPANADCSCCGHNVSYVHPDGRSEILKSWFEKSGKVRFSHYWWKGFFHPDSLMFRSENILQDVEYRHPLFFDDNYITYVFGHLGKMYFLKDVMSCYYVTETGIWHGQSRTIGWLRTVTIYEYLSKIYKRNRLTGFLRSVPLCYLLLNKSEDLDTETMRPYFEVAEKNGAKRVAKLGHVKGAGKQMLRIFYMLLYAANACLKRVF